MWKKGKTFTLLLLVTDHTIVVIGSLRYFLYSSSCILSISSWSLQCQLAFYHFCPYCAHKAFLSLHAILRNSVLVGCTFSFFPSFLLLFFLQLFVKISSDNHFAFLLFFFFRMVLFAASCTILQTSVHSSSGIVN